MISFMRIWILWIRSICRQIRVLLVKFLFIWALFLVFYVVLFVSSSNCVVCCIVMRFVSVPLVNVADTECLRAYTMYTLVLFCNLILCTFLVLLFLFLLNVLRITLSTRILRLWDGVTVWLKDDRCWKREYQMHAWKPGKFSKKVIGDSRL